MKKFVASLALSASLLAGTSACPGDSTKINTAIEGALSFAQFACVQLSSSTSSAEVAVACKVVDEVAKLTPEVLAFVEQLISNREAAKRAGLTYDAKAGWKRPQ